MEIPRQVLDTLADNADAIAAVLTGGRAIAVAAVVAKLPKVGPVAKVALAALIAAVKMSPPMIRKINKQARENHDYLTATLTQFKLDLDQGETDRLLIRGK
jgi:hypothetical protein